MNLLKIAALAALLLSVSSCQPQGEVNESALSSPAAKEILQLANLFDDCQKEMSLRKLPKVDFMLKSKIEEHQEGDLIEVAVVAGTPDIAREALPIAEKIHRERYPELKLEFIVMTIEMNPR